MRQVLPRSKKKKKDRDQFLLIFIPPVSRSMPDKQWILNNSTAYTKAVGASSWEILQDSRFMDSYCVREERI